MTPPTDEVTFFQRGQPPTRLQRSSRPLLQRCGRAPRALGPCTDDDFETGHRRSYPGAYNRSGKPWEKPSESDLHTMIIHDHTMGFPIFVYLQEGLVTELQLFISNHNPFASQLDDSLVDQSRLKFLGWDIMGYNLSPPTNSFGVVT